MNTYKVRETLDSAYDLISADFYYVDDNLTFYVRKDDGNETAVATFRFWVSVMMLVQPTDE